MPDFLSMFLDEAWLAGRVRHPNVVSVFDVVSRQGELSCAASMIRHANGALR